MTGEDVTELQVTIGNEDIPLWEEYTCRDEPTQPLWKQFYQPLPANVWSEPLRPAWAIVLTRMNLSGF
jgi:hypothetical protein